MLWLHRDTIKLVGQIASGVPSEVILGLKCIDSMGFFSVF